MYILHINILHVFIYKYITSDVRITDVRYTYYIHLLYIYIQIHSCCDLAPEAHKVKTWSPALLGGCRTFISEMWLKVFQSCGADP